MTRQFTAALLSLSLAFTSVSAAPARAAEDDLGKFIVGAIALLAIGKALEDQNKSSPARRTETATAKSKTYVQPTWDDRTWNDRNRWDDRFGRDDRYYDRDGKFRRDGKKPKKLKEQADTTGASSGMFLPGQNPQRAPWRIQQFLPAALYA